MIKGKVVLAIFVSVLILVGVYFFVAVGTVQQSGNSIKSISTGQTTQNVGSENITSQKFSDSADYQYSHLISSPLSADAKTAINGFQLSQASNSDGSITYTFTAIEQSYTNQTYNVKPGENLYFIEKSSGDDDLAANADYGMRDDYAVIVDGNGYIVQ